MKFVFRLVLWISTGLTQQEFTPVRGVMANCLSTFVVLHLEQLQKLKLWKYQVINQCVLSAVN